MLPLELSSSPAPTDRVFAARPTGVIDSATLMSDSKLIHIEHRGQLYSLRETRLGKLILTK